MRLAAVFFAMSLLTAVAAWGQNESGPEAVISRQIDAFLDDDFVAAFQFASPNIQRLFRTPENFGLMVQEGYPMVWRPGSVEFLGTRLENGQPITRVMIRDRAGVLHWLDYYMVEGADGWRIDGVDIVDPPGVGV